MPLQMWLPSKVWHTLKSVTCPYKCNYPQKFDLPLKLWHTLISVTYPCKFDIPIKVCHNLTSVTYHYKYEIPSTFARSCTYPHKHDLVFMKKQNWNTGCIGFECSFWNHLLINILWKQGAKLFKCIEQIMQKQVLSPTKSPPQLIFCPTISFLKLEKNKPKVDEKWKFLCAFEKWSFINEL